MSIEGQGRFLTLAQGRIHTKCQIKFIQMMTRSALDLFYGKVKFGNLGFSIGKSENLGFFRKYCSQ